VALTTTSPRAQRARVGHPLRRVLSRRADDIGHGDGVRS
jgi:hypothetical protein